MTRGAKCRAIPFLKRARLVRGGWCPQDRLLRERPHLAPHHFSQDQRGGRLDQGHTAGLWVAARPSCPQAQSRLHSYWFCPFGSFLFEVVWARATPRARRMLKTTAPPPPPPLRQAGTPHGASCGAWLRGTPGACPQSFPPPRGGGECHGTAGLVAVCLGTPGACPRVS